MAETYSRPEGADKHQNIPKIMLVLVIVCALAIVIAVGYVMRHHQNRTGGGQPADQVSGPQLGAAGPASNVNGRAVSPAALPGSGQGGGPGAMGSGAGVGQGTPGTAGTRTGGASSGPSAGPSAGAP